MDTEEGAHRYEQEQVHNWFRNKSRLTPYEVLRLKPPPQGIEWGVHYEYGSKSISSAYRNLQRKEFKQETLGLSCDPVRIAELCDINCAYNDILKIESAKSLYDSLLKRYDENFSSTNANEDEQQPNIPTAAEVPEGVNAEDFVTEGALAGMPTYIRDRLRVAVAALEELEAQGFPSEEYEDSHPLYYRSFQGLKIHGTPIAESFNMPGFIYYMVRGILFQRILNTGLMSGGAEALTVEWVFALISMIVYSIVYLVWVRPDHSIPPYVLKWARYFLYFLEFIMHCVALDIATNEGVSPGILFFAGLFTLWSCLTLSYANHIAFNGLLQSKFSGKFAHEFYDEDESCNNTNYVGEIYLKRDASINGYAGRISMNIAALPALLLVNLALVSDALRCLAFICSCDNKKNRRHADDDGEAISGCLTFAALIFVLHTSGTCTKKMGDCCMNHSLNRAEQIVTQHGMKSKNNYFLYMELVYKLERLVTVGRQLMFLYSICGCLRPAWWRSYLAFAKVLPTGDEDRGANLNEKNNNDNNDGSNEEVVEF